jgi:hypothetical protein
MPVDKIFQKNIYNSQAHMQRPMLVRPLKKRTTEEKRKAQMPSCTKLR